MEGVTLIPGIKALLKHHYRIKIILPKIYVLVVQSNFML